MGRALALALALAACGDSPAAPPATDGGGGAPDAPRQQGECAGRLPQEPDATWVIQGRNVHVHVPPSYDPGTPLPLVVNFHYLAGSADLEESLSGMTPKADEAGFAVIYPEGTGVPQSWNAGACCAPANTSGVDDVAFARDLLDEAQTRLCIDAKRVFVTGMSNGAFLSHRLACELSDRIAAAAPVAGVNGMTSCAPSRPISIMHFHGTADLLVPWDGGGANAFIPVEQSFSDWAQRDGCAGDPVVTYQNGDVTCSTYEQCQDGVEVTLCRVENGGHQWPGSDNPIPLAGNTTQDISATDAMWDFFTRHPLP